MNQKRKMTLERIRGYPTFMKCPDTGEVMYKFVMCNEIKPESYDNHLVVYGKNHKHVDDKLDKLGLDAVQYYYFNEDKDYLEMY